jgi:hypothetical protein
LEAYDRTVESLLAYIEDNTGRCRTALTDFTNAKVEFNAALGKEKWKVYRCKDDIRSLCLELGYQFGENQDGYPIILRGTRDRGVDVDDDNTDVFGCLSTISRASRQVGSRLAGLLSSRTTRQETFPSVSLYGSI